MLNKLLKSRYKKGFTLVEVIIVLVILAILAAVMIPSLTGYIDRANESSVVGEARDCLVAAQTAISEYYASGNLVKYLNGQLTGMNAKKTNKYGIPRLDDEGNPVLDKKGNVVYDYTQAGRISTSTFYCVQNGKNNGSKPQEIKNNQGDTAMAKQILIYLDSLKHDKHSRYLFNTNGVKLGKDVSKNDNYATADNYFKSCPKEDVAINIYYDATGKVVMVHFAKRGFNKIIEMYPSGKYSLIDKVSVLDK